MAVLAFLYGLLCYGVFLPTLLYAVGFLGGFGVPRTVDMGGPSGPTGVALAVDLALLGLFAVQHSLMARQGFKRLWTRLIPASVERSTYVLFSSLVLILLFWQWRPIPQVVWDLQSALGRGVLWAVFALGWLLLLVATCLIDHFELFGLAPVWRRLRSQASPAPCFREPSLYRIVRHPLYVGWIATFWAAPSMTAGHLLFALVATLYILVAVRFEERDLKSLHPEYAEYSRRVPMLIPRFGRRKR